MNSKQIRLERIAKIKQELFWDNHKFAIGLLLGFIIAIALLVFFHPVASHSHWLI